MIAIDGEVSWKNFQTIIQNGSGLYPDLPAEVKAFADEVTVGKILQPYKDDLSSELIRCSVCCRLKPVDVIVYKGVTPKCSVCESFSTKEISPT